MKKPYRVAIAGYLLGAHRKVGDAVNLTEAEAKYLLLDGTVTEGKPAKPDAPRREPSPVDLEKKTR